MGDAARDAAARCHPDRPLLDVLREELQLTGAKYGCGESRCGACSVLVDGKRVFSCRVPASTAEGKAKFTGLPSRVRRPPLEFEATKDDLSATLDYDPATECVAAHKMTLQKPAPQAPTQ